MSSIINSYLSNKLPYNDLPCCSVRHLDYGQALVGGVNFLAVDVVTGHGLCTFGIAFDAAYRGFLATDMTICSLVSPAAFFTTPAGIIM